ncbi:MAG: hypothetical protein U0L18_08945 [Acutalibacteraceae bacterium]|nr:hypothetical protein [Acutalibacteraceae bacterium]
MENNKFGGMSFDDYQKFLKQEQGPVKEDAASDLRTKMLMHRVVDNDELIRKALFLGMLDNGMMSGINGIAQTALLRRLR